MIIGKIHSGLGNQLFQYAAALAAALRSGAELRFDLNWFHLPESAVRLWRPLKLTDFPGIQLPEAPRELCWKFGSSDFYGFSPVGKVRRRLHRLLTVSRCISDPAGPESFPDDDFALTGYFQSERYFEDCIPELRRHLVFPPLRHPKSLALAERLRRIPMVSCHLRLTDYESSPADAANFSGFCTAEYYRRALKRFSGLPVVLFSDDPETARKRLPQLADCTVVDWNAGNPVEDLQLMSLASGGHVIANSSFSWWGAWLDPDPEKRVIAPAVWSRETELPTLPRTPANWLRLGGGE